MGAGQAGEEVGPGAKGQGQSGTQVGLAGGGDWVGVGGEKAGEKAGLVGGEGLVGRRAGLPGRVIRPERRSSQVRKEVGL